MDLIKDRVIKYIRNNNGVVSSYLEKHNSINNISKSKKERIIELKQIADLWIDKNGNYINGWETGKNKTVLRNKGTFMNSVIKELFYISITSNNDSEKLIEMINNSELNTELNIYFIICSIVMLPYNTFIFKSNEFDQSRKILIDSFTTITKNPTFWSRLEELLDTYSLDKRNIYLEQINNLLKQALIESRVLGCINEQKYNKTRNRLVNSYKKIANC